MASEYGVDLRDMHRKGSRMTMRWLWVRIQGLPQESWLKCEIAAADEQAETKTTAEQLRARQAHYASKGAPGG